MNLSENLKKIRKEHHLSQEQFAEKLGVSRQSVSKWESDLAYPDLDKIIQISTIFNIQVDDLLNQNIQEVSNEKKSKVALNKMIDSFLLYITKSIDMFSSMKLQTKLKCIFEQIIIIFIFITIFIIFALIGNYVVDGFISSFPRVIYTIIWNILSSLYTVASIILGITLMFHIFKIRYLDYYEIVDEKEEHLDESGNFATIPHEKGKDQKIFLEKKQTKIIIRNPNGKDYKFIKGMLKMTLLFMKMIVGMIALGVCLLLIALTCCFICTFLISKTGLFFVGLLLSFFASIIITWIFLQIIIHFIIDRKGDKKKMLYSFLSSLIILGVGLGLTLIGFTKFQYIQDTDSRYYKSSTFSLEMKENLVIEENLPISIEYIEEDRKDLKVEILHTDFCNVKYIDRDNKIHFYYSESGDFLKMIRTQIKDFNQLKIIDYFKIEIKVYLSANHLEKLQKNNKEYFEDLRNEKITRYEQQENAYQEKVYDLEMEINRLKDQYEALELLYKECQNLTVE